jgi:hypothetical protein
MGLDRSMGWIDCVPEKSTHHVEFLNLHPQCRQSADSATLVVDAAWWLYRTAFGGPGCSTASGKDRPYLQLD